MEALNEKWQYTYRKHMDLMLKLTSDTQSAMNQFNYFQSMMCGSEPSQVIESMNLNNCHDVFTSDPLNNAQILLNSSVVDCSNGSFWKYYVPFDMPKSNVSLARSISLIDIYNINPYDGSYLGSIQQKKEM